MLRRIGLLVKFARGVVLPHLHSFSSLKVCKVVVWLKRRLLADKAPKKSIRAYYSGVRVQLTLTYNKQAAPKKVNEPVSIKQLTSDLETVSKLMVLWTSFRVLREVLSKSSRLTLWYKNKSIIQYRVLQVNSNPATTTLYIFYGTYSSYK